MPRKKKTPATETTSPSADVTQQEAITSEPTAALAVIESPSPVAEIPASDPAPAENEQPPAPSRPHWIQTVKLGRENDSPKMQLGRSERFQQMVIQFDEKPTDETRIQLGEAGWRWRAAESQWTKQLDFESRARGQYDAEKLFETITRHERSERGLPATLPSFGK